MAQFPLSGMMASATQGVYRMTRLNRLILGQSISPAASGHQNDIRLLKAWRLDSGLYTARQMVEGFSPLLDTVVHRLGRDPPHATPAKKMLLDSVLSNLSIGTRETTLPLAGNNDASRKEMADQAAQIGEILVQYAFEATEKLEPSLKIRSPCENHLLTHPVAELIFGPRSEPHLMQLLNEYMHQMVLLRDALLPFQNYDEVLIPIDAKKGLGMRHMEQARLQFLTNLMTKSVTQASVVEFAKALLAPDLPTLGGFGFQYEHGLIIPAFLAGGSSYHLLQYVPAKLDQDVSTVNFDYELADYFSAPRQEIPAPAATLEQGAWPPTPSSPYESKVKESSIMVVNPGKGLSRQLKLQLKFENGSCTATDLGQIARGRRYAYLAAGFNTSNGHSNGHANDTKSTNGLNKDSVIHSALTIISSPGGGLLTSKNGGLHVIPAQEAIVSLALLGKLYPENVVLLPEGESPAAVEKAGKSFEPKFVIVGGSTMAVPKAAF